MKTFNEFISESATPEEERLRDLGLLSEVSIAKRRLLRAASGRRRELAIPNDLADILVNEVLGLVEEGIESSSRPEVARLLKRMGISPSELDLIADYGENDPKRWLMEAVADSDLLVTFAYCEKDGTPRFVLGWENGPCPERLDKLLQPSYGLETGFDQDRVDAATVAYADWIESIDNDPGLSGLENFEIPRG